MTKNVTKTAVANTLVTSTVASVWAFWDFDNDCPLYNPGRDDSESWGVPEAEIPPTMAVGFDLAKGVLRVFNVDTCKEWASAMAKQETDAKRRKVWQAIAKDPAKVAAEQRLQRAKDWQAKDSSQAYTISDESDKGQTALEISYRECGNILANCEGEITHFAIAGQRRLYSLPFTCAVAVEYGTVANPCDFHVLGTETEFTHVSDLHDMLTAENDATGKRGYSDVGKLRNAIIFMREDSTMKELALGFRLGIGNDTPKNMRGQRQKFHTWAMVANKFDDGVNNELDLYNRINMQPEYYKSGPNKDQPKYVKGGWIPVKSLDATVGRSILGRVDSKTKQDPISKEIVGEEGHGKPWTVKQIEEYFQMLVTKKKPERITPKNIEAWKDNKAVASRTTTVGEVLQAIHDNNFAFFSGKNDS